MRISRGLGLRDTPDFNAIHQQTRNRVSFAETRQPGNPIKGRTNSIKEFVMGSSANTLSTPSISDSEVTESVQSATLMSTKVKSVNWKKTEVVGLKGGKELKRKDDMKL